jgi:hypothetical protein
MQIMGGRVFETTLPARRRDQVMSPDLISATAESRRCDWLYKAHKGNTRSRNGQICWERGMSLGAHRSSARNLCHSHNGGTSCGCPCTNRASMISATIVRTPGSVHFEQGHLDRRSISFREPSEPVPSAQRERPLKSGSATRPWERCCCAGESRRPIRHSLA